MNKSAIRAHVKAIDNCNQRGGRMLSLVDLIDAGTVDLPLAAYLAAITRSGASFLVGARPGGAGKTAVMCALLNFLPDHTAICPVDGRSKSSAPRHDARPGDTCYLAHEVGRGHYYAYVWGDEARAFFRLASIGHIIATNLHADTIEQTRQQLCQENGVAPAHLDAVQLKVFLRVQRTGDRSMRRWVDAVYESDGTQDRLVWKAERDGAFTRQDLPGNGVVSPEQEREYAEFLNALVSRDTRRIADVRRALVQRGNRTTA